MNDFKIGDKQYTMIGTAYSSVICSNELHQDIFRTIKFFTDEFLNKNGIPDIDLTSKLAYVFIKCGNEKLFPTYQLFMKSVPTLKPFYDADNLMAIMDEALELLETKREEKTDETDNTEENSENNNAKKKTKKA